MVDAGLRHPSDFLTSNLVESYTVSGRVLENGSGLPGVTVSITGTDVNSSTTTNNNGEYSFINIPSGTYTLTASKTEYLFSPQSVTVTVDNANVSVQDILASYSTLPPTHDIQNITFVTIPGGTFQMGDIENVGYSSYEKPVHTVTVSSFEMSVYEITNAQYVAFLNAVLTSGDVVFEKSGFAFSISGPEEERCYMATKESYIETANNNLRIMHNNGVFSVVSGHENWPVVGVTWYGAKAFALYYEFDLPTEAEWEYACRGGRQYKYGTDDGTIDSTKANYGGRGPLSPTGPAGHPVDVGSYPANPYGLHDMTGNVIEWCHDWYGSYTNASESNPSGPQTGFDRVTRGGCYAYYSTPCRAAYRDSCSPGIWNPYYGGFRVVRRASPQNY